MSIEIEEKVENFLYYALCADSPHRSIRWCHVSYYPKLARKFVVSCDGYRLHAYPLEDHIANGFYELGKKSLTPSICQYNYPNWQTIVDSCLNGTELHVTQKTEDRVIFDCAAELDLQHYLCALVMGQPTRHMGGDYTRPVMLIFENGAFAVLMPRLPQFNRKI